MKLQETMAKLRAAGTEQNRKTYARHGAKGEMFGVSYEAMGKIAKAIGTDHSLAIDLWETANHDARILALRVADPARMVGKALDAWARELDGPIIADAFSHLAAKSPIGGARAMKWIGSSHEWMASCGWGVIALHAMDESANDDFEAHLATIERTIRRAKNRVRHAMNNALIAIGIRNEALSKLAIEAARRIGKVEVDHGETECKTPDAEAYILKTLAHRASKAKGSKRALSKPR